MMNTAGRSGEPGKPGRMGAGGAGGAGGTGGEPSGTGGTGGAGGTGGVGAGLEYGQAHRRFRSLVMFGVLLASVSILLSSWLYVRSVNARQALAAESVERRDQTCKLFEREELGTVLRLRRTYAYLEKLPRSAYGTNLTKAIVRGLPAIEQEAREEVAPPYCDMANPDGSPIGLGEPDPKLPEPQDFSELLKRP